MKKKRYFLHFLALTLALLLALTGCSGGSAEPEGDVGTTEDEGSKSEYAAPENESNADFNKRYLAAIEEKVAEDYAGELDVTHEAVQAKISSLHKHMSYRSGFKKNPDETIVEVSAEFKDLLPFRSEGSLIAPEAPESYDGAVTFITAEFADYINADTQAAVDTALAGMQDTYGQASFDAARRALWDEFGCDADTDTYWQVDAEEAE